MNVKDCTRFIQYGTPRTGSTFQFYLVLVILRISKDTRPIIKQHQLDSHNSCLFVSRIGQSIRDASLKHETVLKVQNFNRFSEYPEEQIASVFRLFNLSASHEHTVLVHMRLWMILRRCCGTQSSESHRKQVHTNTDGIFDENTANCHIYNMSAIENAVLQRSWKGDIVIEYARPPLYKGFCEHEDAKLKRGLDFNDMIYKPHNVFRF